MNPSHFADWPNSATTLARLPDGRIVRPNTWLESLPPQPQGIAVVEITEATEAPPKPTPAA